MSSAIDLDEKDRELVSRCRKALPNLPMTASLSQIMFWMSLVAVVVGTIVLLALALIRGANTVPEDTMSTLLCGWVWVFLCWIACRSLRTEVQLVRLVCKLTQGEPGTVQRTNS